MCRSQRNARRPKSCSEVSLSRAARSGERERSAKESSTDFYYLNSQFTSQLSLSSSSYENSSACQTRKAIFLLTKTRHAKKSAAEAETLSRVHARREQKNHSAHACLKGNRNQKAHQKYRSDISECRLQHHLARARHLQPNPGCRVWTLLLE